MRVKVCGIRRREELVMGVRSGADAIGLLVGQRHRSEDFLEPGEARELAVACPPLVTPVLVTHYEEVDLIVELARQIQVTTIQVHSDCGAAALRGIRRALPGVRLIRAIHATGTEAVDQVRDLSSVVNAIILDSINTKEDRVGGTGMTHDWMLSRRVVSESPVPVILAGGLDASNVAEAIATVRPYAVDANTRLRGVDGFKSAEKLGSFVRTAKSTFFELARQREPSYEHGFGHSE